MKGTLKKIKRQGTGRKEIFAMHVSDRALDPKHIKSSYNSITKNRQPTEKVWAKDVTPIPHKIKMQMVSKYMKRW